MPTAATQPTPISPNRSRRLSGSRTPTTAGGELRDAKQTLKDREKQLKEVNLRSAQMNNSAANFATAAQGLLDLQNKKKK